MSLQEAPIMRATASELFVAPELRALVALDAVLAVAACQLAAENPDITLTSLAHGEPPSPEAREATSLILRIANLRAAMRDYRDLSLRGLQTDIPF
jgi:hypothetical protein